MSAQAQCHALAWLLRTTDIRVCAILVVAKSLGGKTRRCTPCCTRTCPSLMIKKPESPRFDANNLSPAMTQTQAVEDPAKEGGAHVHQCTGMCCLRSPATAPATAPASALSNVRPACRDFTRVGTGGSPLTSVLEYAFSRICCCSCVALLSAVTSICPLLLKLELRLLMRLLKSELLVPVILSALSLACPINCRAYAPASTPTSACARSRKTRDSYAQAARASCVLRECNGHSVGCKAGLQES